MAMDSLKNLVNNVPDWLQRLDDFSGQKDRRQAQLAAVAAAEGKSAERKSLRNKGSTESLNPKDHPPVVHAEPPANEDILDAATPENKIQTPVNAEALVEDGWDTVTLVDTDEVQVVCYSPHENVELHDATENTANTSEELEVPQLHPPHPSCINNQINTATKRHLRGEYDDGERTRGGRSAKVEDVPPSYAEVVCECAAAESKRQTPVNIEDHGVHTKSSGPSRQQQKTIKVAQAKAGPQVRKTPKSPSMMSNEDAPVACQTRDKIIVYYDSYVLSFFDDLVRFASSSQDLIRKAKLAARIAHCKRLAEQDVPEDGNNDDALPSLRYMSSRRFGPMSMPLHGTKNRRSDAYDKLDKGLEFVQSMCENGAYQFLCDGDCNDEISKVQKRLTEVLEMAKTEMERLECEEPELAKERHDMIAGLQEDSPTTTKQDGKLETMDQMETIEVDPKYVGPNINETDEGICMELELP
ncbi:uncharacterized protein FPRO_14806 [Fusarium proliferatum ET1]|uniref:Uncharacterized protein n=1 Tax=Fusarium proliferatum (strain ET1) TaxID=1227346 RepID=A0A1L7WB70_FUSPR|nr:uncharacterized protein FPRO_14806 [Fusarium proliferatum ET1]CZR49716.1 uncharacterized protein FPRO_14806 [Fusarium proliferatum ET1]